MFKAKLSFYATVDCIRNWVIGNSLRFTNNVFLLFLFYFFISFNNRMLVLNFFYDI